MNRLGVYDVDAAFDKMSLQTAEEFGLDAILEQLVRAADVEGVRRLRKRARAELTMTHRLFLLRDDAIFLHILGFCWFVDTERRLRYAGAE